MTMSTINSPQFFYLAIRLISGNEAYLRFKLSIYSSFDSSRYVGLSTIQYSLCSYIMEQKPLLSKYGCWYHHFLRERTAHQQRSSHRRFAAFVLCDIYSLSTHSVCTLHENEHFQHSRFGVFCHSFQTQTLFLYYCKQPLELLRHGRDE